MDYLLIEGTASVGKTTTVKRLAKRFLSNENGWEKVVGDNVPSLSSKEDFIALYERKGKGWCLTQARMIFVNLKHVKSSVMKTSQLIF